METLINRIRKMLEYKLPQSEIRAKLLAEKFPEEDIFLAYCAAVVADREVA